LRNPYLFADTGIPRQLRLVYEAGARKSLVTVKIAGGAQMMVESNPFHIGKRNILAVRKALWRAGTLIAAADVGGRESRTVRLGVGSGRFLMSTGCRREEVMERSANGDLCFDRG
jgi:chemotaxis protein CheD